MRGGGFSFGETSPQGGLRAKGDVRRQGEGGYPKYQKFEETPFMDGPLVEGRAIFLLILCCYCLIILQLCIC